MVQYATAAELAGYMQQDVDTYTANLVLSIVSQRFSSRADTMFAPTSVTYQFIADGCRKVRLPFWPINSVSAVRVAGATVAASDYTLIRDTVYRKSGIFGALGLYAPDLGEVDLNHGYAAVTDDVKGAVLESAASAYAVAVPAVLGESIDDYQVRYSAVGGGVQLTPSAVAVADFYRGAYVA